MATTKRKPLSRERILDTALVLVDEEGIETLSMRKLGQALGYEAMSLYNHVANKDDLLDGILDLVLAECALHGGAVEDRRLDERHVRRHERGDPGRQVVDHHRLQPGIQQCLHDVRADVTRASGDQPTHARNPIVH